MEIQLNKNVVISVKITDDMRKDYAECRRMAALIGCGWKPCTSCSLDIPSGGVCLAQILSDLNPDWWVIQEQRACNQTKCNMQYQGRCMSKKPPCIRSGETL